MSKKPDPTLRVLEELGRVIRHLTRISGGPDDGPAMTTTQRLALFELAEEGPRPASSSASPIPPIAAPCTSR